MGIFLTKYKNLFDCVANHSTCPKCMKKFEYAKASNDKVYNRTGTHLVLKCCENTWYFWPSVSRLFLEQDNRLLELKDIRY